VLTDPRATYSTPRLFHSHKAERTPIPAGSVGTRLRHQDNLSQVATTGSGCRYDDRFTVGLAVVPDGPKVDPNNSGQIVDYGVSIVESSSELEDSLGLSIGAEMR